MTKPIYAEVTAYKNHIVVEYKTKESNDIVTTPFDTGSLGYVIADVGFVAISKEAHELLSHVKRSHDDIGDIDIFELDKGGYAFGSFGGMYFIANVDEAEGSSSFVVPPLEEFQLMENNVPDGAKDAIDNPREEEE